MHRFIFIFLCIIIFWSPIPLGSHRIWSAALLELLIASLAVLWLLSPSKESLLNKSLNQNKMIIGLFWLIPLWSALQLVPLPPAVTALLSPHSVSYFPADTWHSLSLDSGATLYKLQKSIAYALFFTLALAIINTPEKLNLIAQVVVISGVLQAAYGVLVVLGGLEFDFLHIRDIAHPHLSSATGTFISRNNFAQRQARLLIEIISQVI